MFESLRRVFGKRLSNRSCRPASVRLLALESLESRVVPTAVTDTQVVNLYRIFLDRVPEAPALAAWSGALESGRITVGQMTERILLSPEHTGRAVTGAYEAYLGRTPESVGLTAHAGAIQRGVSPERVDAAILGSQEYFGLQGSDNTAFVRGLYLDVLGREADSAGLEAHVGRLARGASRTEVAYAFLTCGERGRQVAGDAYREALGREGTEAELAGWAGVLSRSAGGSTAVWASVAGSPEANRSLSSPSLVHNPVLATNGFLRASLPNLVHTSDTGASNSDNVTFARTPDLTGSVDGSVSQVQLYIDGRVADLVPVVSGVWNYKVPAQKALGAGIHTFRVQPLDSSGGKAGLFSHLLRVTTVTAPPNATTVGLAPQSDSGAQGDGMTTEAAPTLRGIASPGLLVNVSIDGVVAGRVKADTRTGVWEFKSPRLANGVHDIAAVAENNAGLQSSARSFELTVKGERTVVLDGTDGNTVELTASHLLGRNSQGFIVTQVERGTLQRWSAAKNDWVNIPNTGLATDASTLQNAPAIRRIGYEEVVRWTPSSGDLGVGPAFAIVPLDTAGGLTAPTPEAGTVPGRIRNPQIDFTAGVGTMLTWAAPTDGCGCGSTRYSVEVTREDGQTLVYNVASGVRAVSVVEGGRVLQAELWGATKSGAGERRFHDAVVEQRIKNRLAYNALTGLSVMPLGLEARTQLGWSPTEIAEPQSSFVLGESHADLAYVEVHALPDDVEAAQGLEAGSLPIVSAESNKLTDAQKAKLEDNPILARNLFPGTVNGQVQPDQMRVHFQAGEKLRFAGSVHPSVRNRATIVIEEAPILANNSLGHWYAKARIPISGDGGFSHDHEVQYGMTAVRARLELANPQPQAAARTVNGTLSVGSAAPTSPPIVSTPITLSYNAFGITTPPWQVANHQGFDRNGNYYNSDYTGSSTSNPIPGTPITYNGIEFPIGPIPTSNSQVGGSSGPSNFVQARGQTITVSVDADKSDYLYLAGAASNGNQLSQKFTLTFTDGTTETWTQSFTDWSNNGSSAKPQPFSGEWLLSTQPERINQEGDLVATPAYVFAYGYHLRGKQLASITLPNNENVGILSAVVTKSPAIAIGEVESLALGQINLTGVDILQVTIRNESNIGAGGGPLTFFFADNPVSGSVATPSQPATYTTKQVTVPMGQQQTITYVGPDSTSQLSFYVQKEDGTCVGPNCSTYLPDWKDGSGRSSDFAANISPSLNSQVKSGQHWTMTIQNSAEGYYGYLDSPSGQGLPSANGNIPAGAQFKLMTQAEINSQPPWATALEEAVGILVGVAVMTVATGGVADFFIADAEATGTIIDGSTTIVDGTTDGSTTITVNGEASGAIGEEGGGQVVTQWYENLITDSFIGEATGTGEGGVFFDDVSIIGEDVEDADSVLDGSWSELDAEFDAEVEVDIGAAEAAAEQQQIIEAQRETDRINAAIRKALFSKGLF
jgi:hypothetical protein